MASDMQAPVLATTDPTNAVIGAPPPVEPAGQAGRLPPPQPPVSRAVALAWCLSAVVLVAGAAWGGYAVARATAFTPAHRAAAAWTGPLVVGALAVPAPGILLSYPGRGTQPDPPPANPPFRPPGAQ